MIKIGQTNSLEIVKEVDFGLYLDDGAGREILLPKRYVPEEYKLGEYIDVFVYLDSEDLRIATTETPYAQVGEFAYLNVVAVNKVGAFMDWGLLKDLLVPFAEQKTKMQTDQSYVVRVQHDEQSGRIYASSKLDKFLSQDHDLTVNQEVEIMVYEKTDIGYNAIINKQFKGLLYHNEVFQHLKMGRKMTAYVKKLRADNKIDLSLQQQGYAHVDQAAVLLYQKLQQNSDFLPLHDKSDSQLIQQMLKMSKKTFKKAVGQLYKKRIIKISDSGIKLIGKLHTDK